MDKKYIVLSLLAVCFSATRAQQAQLKPINPAKPGKEKLTPAIRSNIQTFLETKNGAGLDMRGADLRNQDLKAANLKGAILKTYTQMCPAVVGTTCKSYRQKANLSGAKLQGANISSAKLYEAIFDGANLQGADLRGADLTLASFKNTNMDGALIDETTTMPDGKKYSQEQLAVKLDDNGLKEILPRIQGLPNLPWLNPQHDICQDKNGLEWVRCKMSNPIG